MSDLVVSELRNLPIFRVEGKVISGVVGNEWPCKEYLFFSFEIFPIIFDEKFDLVKQANKSLKSDLLISYVIMVNAYVAL